MGGVIGELKGRNLHEEATALRHSDICNSAIIDHKVRDFIVFRVMVGIHPVHHERCLVCLALCQEFELQGNVP